jgi:hypothetical protein
MFKEKIEVFFELYFLPNEEDVRLYLLGQITNLKRAYLADH